MDKAKQTRLQAVGFRLGDAEDFLGLTTEERELVELRLLLGQATRAKREGSGLSQEEVARRMGSSQSRVAKIESGEAGVSLDLTFKAFFVVGGKVADLPLLQPGKVRRIKTVNVSGGTGKKQGKPRHHAKT